MNFEKMVQRAVNAKAKTGLWSSITVRNSDIHCSRDYHSFNSTVSKVQTQGTTAKKLRPEESKPKEAKPVKGKAFVLTQTNMVKFLKQSKKNKKDKKRRFPKYKQDHIGKQKEQNPATGTNVTNARSKKKYLDIACYNYNKKGHYLKSCPELPKN